MARDRAYGASDRDRSASFFGRDDQELPRGDNRHRVNSSSRFYVAQLVCGSKGCTLNVSESAERVRHRQDGQTQVDFDGQRYRLRRAEELTGFVQKFSRGGCIVYVGGKSLEGGREIVPAPFIYVRTTDALRKLREFHPAVK